MRRMLLHELHPALVHAPLVLLPADAIVDTLAFSRRSSGLSQLGRRFWFLGTGSALLAGLAGLAAS